jgi:hypothetical protein
MAFPALTWALSGLQAAAQLLERKEWGQVVSVAAAMATVASSQQHLQRAVQVWLPFCLFPA